MRIAYVVPEFVTEVKGGGLASYINNISRILADRGHEITIVVKSDYTELIDYYPNIKVQRVNVNLENVNRDIPGSIYREWSRVLNDKLWDCHLKWGDYDIVQYANWNALGVERTSIPTVIRISSDLPLWRNANRLKFDPQKIYNCEKVTDYLEDIALLKADSIFGPSNLIANVVSNRIGKQIEVIESPFYPSEEQRNCGISNSELQGKRYLFTYGSLNLLKGIKLIGDSIDEILRLDSDILYVFAGVDSVWEQDGEQISAIEYIKKKAGKNESRIIYLGALSREQLYPIIEKSYACVFPSRIDNLPNVCIEAMSYGKVVIGSNGASFEQLIDPGDNGFLMDRENRGSLIEAIDTCLKLSEEDKRRIEYNATKRMEKMKPDLIAKQTIDLYNKTISLAGKRQDNEYYSKIVGLYNEQIDKFVGDKRNLYRL